jgi:pilus assembly protein Flp/PilA
MQLVKNIARKFIREEEGATMVEYGLMLALIAVVCILVITLLGSSVRNTFSTVTNKL